MRFARSLLGYLLAVPVFVTLMALAVAVVVFGERRWLEALIKRVSRLLPRVFGIRVSVDVTGPLPPDDATVVVMSNHVNIFDGFILLGHVPWVFRFLELDSHFRWPFYGPMVRRFGNIPIAHGNPREARATLDAAADRVKAGRSLLILPEGHRTRTGKLRPFGRGAFRIPCRAGVPVVPVALRGLYERKPVSSPWVVPGRVDLVFGEPIPAAEVAAASEKELMARVRASIAGMLGED
jgi:1-acyl-sn-glycerol-3-phosphate acyltransferase